MKLKGKRRNYDYIGVGINETKTKYSVENFDPKKGLLIYNKEMWSSKELNINQQSQKSTRHRHLTFRQREKKMLHSGL